MAFTPKVQRQIILDNLHLQMREISATLEARLSHLSDMARVLCATLEDVTPNSLDSLLEKQPPEAVVLHREALPQNREYLEEVLITLTISDKVQFCFFLAKTLQEKDPTLTPYAFLPQGEEIRRIAYCRNNLTDEAFDIFSLDFDDPTALYCEDFEASCVAVAVGDASACILPHRDASGNRSRMTLGYLATYDLCIHTLYTVYNGEDEGMEYALCTKGARVPDGAYQMFLHINPVTSRDILEIQEAMRLFGLIPSELTYSYDKLSICLAGEVPLLPPLVWLTLFHPHFVLEGLTKQLDKEMPDDFFL